MEGGAVWSRSLSLGHTKIMSINPDNLIVDQHVLSGDLTVINMCSPWSSLKIEGEIQITPPADLRS